MKLNCLTLGIYPIILTLTHGQTERFHGGQCHHGPDDVILYDTMYAECVDQCRARTGCASISANTVGKICRLHVTNVVAAMTLWRCPGFVFSKKEAWIQKEVVGCEAGCPAGTACELGTAAQQANCTYKECPAIPSIQNGTIHGNRRSVGSRLLYECDLKFKVINGDAIRSCVSEGQWSGGETICGQTEFYLPTRSGHSNYNLVDLFVNGISLVNQSNITFKVKANNDAHVMLAPNRVYTNNDVVEIVLGGWYNRKTVIRYGIYSGDIYSTHLETGILSSTNYRTFWITMTPALCIQLGKGAVVGTDQILEWCGIPARVNYIFIGAGYGSDAEFVFP